MPASISPEPENDAVERRKLPQTRSGPSHHSAFKRQRASIRNSLNNFGSLVRSQANAAHHYAEKTFEKRMEELISKESNIAAQRAGRDVTQVDILLSELKHTAPITFFFRKLLYRTESALESVWNRIYALFFTVILLLIFSIIVFIGTLYLSGIEFRNLVGDANGYDDEEDDDGKDYGKENVILFAAWITWSFFTDPGFHTEVDPFRYRFGRMIGAFISLLGILFFSFVLGFVVELMQSFIARVTEGRSSVIETGHYLILGYSEKCVAVIGELAMAMDSDGGGVIVVLADQPTKAEFDMLVDEHLNTLGLTCKSNVVFRPGSPLMTSNLLKVSPETSRSIIVLADSRHDENHSDAMVLRIVLSLKSILGGSGMERRELSSPEDQKEADPDHDKRYLRRRSQNKDLNRKDRLKRSSLNMNKNGIDINARLGSPGRGLTRRLSKMGGVNKTQDDNVIQSNKNKHEFKGHIIAELRDNDNTPIIKVSGGNMVELVVVHDIIGRMLAKSTIQPNIRRIYDDLLGFDGCEFYFASHPELAGKTFQEAALRAQGAVLVGVKREGEILLNPESEIPSTSPLEHRKSGGKYMMHGKNGEFILLRHDEIIVIAEDDSSYEVLDRSILTGDNAKMRPWPPPKGQRTAMQAIDVLEAQEKKKLAQKNAMFMQANSVDGQFRGGQFCGASASGSARISREQSNEGQVQHQHAINNENVSIDTSDTPSLITTTDMEPIDAPPNRRSSIKDNFVTSLSSKNKKTTSASESASISSTTILVAPAPGSSASTSNASDQVDPSSNKLVDNNIKEKIVGNGNSGIDKKLENDFNEEVQVEVQVEVGIKGKKQDGDDDEEEVKSPSSNNRIVLNDDLNVSSPHYLQDNKIKNQQKYISQQSAEQNHLNNKGLRVLLCGWRRDVKDMLNLMEHILPPGSEVHILSEKPPKEVRTYLKDFCEHFRRTEVKHSFGRADVRRRLVKSNSLGFGTENAVDVVVVVADEMKEKDLLLSDSQAIASCLLIRDVQADELEKRDVSLSEYSVPELEKFQIQCPMNVEILDVATRGTIEENPSIKAVADFVVVNDLAARAIAAVADRREVAAVLGELLGPDPHSQDIFVIEATALLYEDEVVKRRASACIDVGDVIPRDEEEKNMSAVRRVSLHPSQFESSSSSSYGQNMNSSKQTKKKMSSVPKAKKVSFSEMAIRAAAAPRHGILLGYIKASWNAKENAVGELATVFNPVSKAAPLYWHSLDFLIIMSMEEHRDPGCLHRFTVVR